MWVAVLRRLFFKKREGSLDLAMKIFEIITDN